MAKKPADPTDSVDRFKFLVESLAEGVGFCAPDTTIVHVNSRLAALLGYAPEELIGKRADQILLGPDKAELLQTKTRNRVETGQVETYEMELLRRDGSHFWASISAAPMRLPDGTITGTVAVIRDISEKKLAAQALEESERKYRDLVETSADLIWSLDLEGKFTFVNQAAKPILGYPAAELLGQPFWFIQGPEDVLTRDLEVFRQVLSGERVAGYETEGLRADGSVVYLSINAKPAFDGQGKLIGATGTASDITHFKLSQIELIQRQRREAFERQFINEVLDSLPSFVFVRDDNGRYTLANRTFADFCGTTPDALIGRSPADFHYTQDAERYLREDRTVLETKEALSIQEELILNPINGEESWAQTTKKLVHSPDGASNQVLTVITDITKRREAELEAIKLLRQLMQSQKMEAIGQLAAGVAHDLNNALGAVVGHLQLMKQHQQLDTDVQKSVRVALDGCERASSLIEQLLGFSRQGRYNLNEVSVARSVSNTINFLGRVIGKDVQIVEKGSRRGLYVLADEAQLQQALINLIINAKQSMPSGGTITFSYDSLQVDNPQRFNRRAKAGGYVVLGVHDTGTGIEADKLDKIFEPFFTSRGDSGGSGLGLSMVYGIMQSHGGWVEVRSDPGRGSSFLLYFPRIIHSRSSMDKSEVEANVKAEGTVLVLDDEAPLVDLTRTFLTRIGLKVQGFTSSHEALRWYEDHYREVNLIIMDMKMPQLDGTACFDEMRRINPGAQIVLLSGYIQDAAVQNLLQRGALRFFQKPLQFPTLAKWVAEQITRRIPAGRTKAANG